MKRVSTPLNALRYIERRLRRTEAYHYATTNQADEGLGQWMKRCIRAAKKGRA